MVVTCSRVWINPLRVPYTVLGPQYCRYVPTEDTGTIANSANIGTIEGSKSLRSSAGSGTTDDYLIVKCGAYALRGQQSTK